MADTAAMTQPVLVPHSPQNFAPSCISAPHSAQNPDFVIFSPHSGQNLPPSTFAPHDAQVTLARLARSRSWVQSTSRTFSWICSTWAAAWAREISSATLGEHTRHWPTSSFQHTALHTQLPHPRHCENCGLTYSTASRSALSLAGEFVARFTSIASMPPESSATLPPNTDPRP